MSRRRILKALGIGAGAVTVLASGGVAWRALDQSVFAPGSGPAYEPWRADLQASPPGSLVGAAILAANAHNTQPWSFAVSPDRIDLFADRQRSMGTMDPPGRERSLSLGCALENLVIAAMAHGSEPLVTLLPDAADPDHVASVSLVPTQPDASELFRAIPNRHTNRAPYDTQRSVSSRLLEQMS